MKLLAIPNFGNRVSPRLDYAESLQLITVSNNGIMKNESIKILANNNLERINMIIALKPDYVICDGISALTHNKLKENNIKVIPWIHGSIVKVVDDFLKNNLIIEETN